MWRSRSNKHLINNSLYFIRCSMVNSIDSELLNMDLRTIGAKSLPDPLNKTSDLHDPKNLQISCVRDISVSHLEGFSNSSNYRLLKFILTDGHNEITAVEYSHIPSIPNDVVPGSKVPIYFSFYTNLKVASSSLYPPISNWAFILTKMEPIHRLVFLYILVSIYPTGH